MAESRDDLVRVLLGSETVGALATLHKGRPAVSMVPFAVSPVSCSLVIHVSRLATHTQDIETTADVALLVTQSRTPEVMPQALPRISIAGTASRCNPDMDEYAVARAAYLERFPESEPMFGFGDFSIVLIEPVTLRVVAGFAQAWSATRTRYLGIMREH